MGLRAGALVFQGEDDGNTRGTATLAFSYGDLHRFSTCSLVMEKGAVAEQRGREGEGEGRSQALWYISLVPTLRRKRKED